MSTPTKPRGLDTAGSKLWGDVIGAVAPGWELDGRDLALLTRACRLADVEAELREDVARDGRTVVGSQGQPVLHPGIREARQAAIAVAALVAKVEIREPRARTGHLDKRARDQLGDARRKRWS
jgi:hypothetical protein